MIIGKVDIWLGMSAGELRNRLVTQFNIHRTHKLKVRQLRAIYCRQIWHKRPDLRQGYGITQPIQDISGQGQTNGLNNGY